MKDLVYYVALKGTICTICVYVNKITFLDIVYRNVRFFSKFVAYNPTRFIQHTYTHAIYIYGGVSNSNVRRDGTQRSLKEHTITHLTLLLLYDNIKLHNFKHI